MGNRRRAAALGAELRIEGSGLISAEDLAGLPEPVRRWLGAAAPPGTPRAASIRLTIRGEMRPEPGARPFDIQAEETLAPGVGFVWLARSRVGLFPMSVLDAYRDGEGFMAGRFLGIVPLMNASGPDISRSSRHRCAAESVFLPSALLPRPGLRWDPVDDERATVVFTIDGEDIPLTVRIDGDGTIIEVTMRRWGDVRRDGFGLTPYGFTFEEHRVIDGVTVPALMRGGWWFGTDRYDPAEASVFRVLEASIR